MTEDPDEAALDPDLPIVDAHHHLWRAYEARAAYALDYEAKDLVADAAGHNVVATVYIDCHFGYRTDGPEALRPVGETEFAVREGGRRGGIDIAAGIVGWADLMTGADVGAVLDAHLEAGQGRFRGVRGRVTWHDDPGLSPNYVSAPAHRLADPLFREGARALVGRGLSLDLFLLQLQLEDVADFAGALPDLPIVLNHLGGYLAEGRFADRPREGFDAWRLGLAEAAKRPNVTLKVGGFGLRMVSPGLVASGGKASSEAMAQAWRPLFETCLETFGPDRCMLESNFPVDRVSGSYRRFWNAFKRMAADLSAAEKAALFGGTAARVYRLSI
jgi:L-fuconolactonase